MIMVRIMEKMVIMLWIMTIIARSWHGYHVILDDHGMVVNEDGMIMVWPSNKMAWSCHGDHGHYYNVVRIPTIQPTLLISKQVVVSCFLVRNMLDEPIRNFPKAI